MKVKENKILNYKSKTNDTKNELINDLNKIDIQEIQKITKEECVKSTQEFIKKLNDIFKQYKDNKFEFTKDQIKELNSILINTTDCLIKIFKLFTDDKQPIDVTANNVHTLLTFFAVENGGDDIYQFFLQYPKFFTIDYDYQLEGIAGCTIIHTAALSGNFNVLNIILKYATLEQFQIPNTSGITPLGYIVAFGKNANDYQLLKTLLEKGAWFSKDDLTQFRVYCNHKKEERKEFLKLLFNEKNDKLNPLVFQFGLQTFSDIKFLEEIIDKTNYNRYQLAESIHFLEVLLDVGSSNYSKLTLEKTAKCLQLFAETIENSTIKEGILKIASGLSQLINQFDSDLSSNETVFNNNLNNHGRFFIFEKGEKNKHKITILAGQPGQN